MAATQSHLKKQQAKIVASKIEAAEPKYSQSYTDLFPDSASFEEADAAETAEASENSQLQPPKQSSTFPSEAIDLVTVAEGIIFQIIGYKIGDMIGRAHGASPRE